MKCHTMTKKGIVKFQDQSQYGSQQSSIWKHLGDANVTRNKEREMCCYEMNTQWYGVTSESLFIHS